MASYTKMNDTGTGVLPALIHAFAADAAGCKASSGVDEGLGTLTLDRDDRTVVARLLGYHGLSGCVFRLLERITAGREDAPGDPAALLRDELRDTFLARHARTLANLAGLRNASKVLAEAQIPLLAMQGAALLAWRIYESVEERPMADADALVREEEWEAAIPLLEKAGFQPSSDGSRWLRGEGILDLHPDPLGMERIEARRRALPLDAEMTWRESTFDHPGNGIEGLRVPTRPMLWATGLAHLQKHSFSCLRWFVDLARLMNTMSDEEIARAGELTGYLRLQASAAIFGDVAGSRWGCTVPEVLFIGLDELDPKSRRLAESASEDISALRDPGLVGERLLWRMAPDPFARFRLIWESAYPSGNVMSEIYPGYRPILRPWYMARRTVGLAGRFLKG